MPQLSGDEVLASIRDRGLDYRVAMVTAIPPDFDTLEVPFDDVTTREEFRTALGRLLAAAAGNGVDPRGNWVYRTRTGRSPSRKR